MNCNWSECCRTSLILMSSNADHVPNPASTTLKGSKQDWNTLHFLKYKEPNVLLLFEICYDVHTYI